ncbi:hypothetical protein K474DRAFT_1706405 [Panus rudis PR-1116 ss-1]|nr:hypothetical protein K474DRAFT_1706405 [Panus rudis PR-1116 ss-1]
MAPYAYAHTPVASVGADGRLSTPSFLLGSSSFSHGIAVPGPGPSSYGDATAFTDPDLGYPLASSHWLPQPVFAYSAPHPVPPSLYKPRPHTLPPSQVQMAVLPPHNPELAQGGSPPQEDNDSPDPSDAPDASQDSAAADGKSRKHQCWMCHRRFDRPSTLRKHLLVHTGEKAFQCQNCKRRFSVASNLSRHAKRCGTKGASPEDEDASTNLSTAAAPDSSSTSALSADDASTPSVTQPSTNSASTPSTTTTRTRKRKPAPVEPPAEHPSSYVDDSQSHKPKRRRRKPSPFRWIPDSLKVFDLTRSNRSTPIPLPPIQPYHDTRSSLWEERNSFDDAVGIRPYHPKDWCGKLPGPGLLKNETMKMGGTLLVF